MNLREYRKMKRVLGKLTFPDELELKFIKDFTEKSLAHNRLTLIAGIVIYDSFYFFDLMNTPDLSYFSFVWRFLILTTVAASTIVISFFPIREKLLQPAIGFSLLIAGIGAIAVQKMSPPPLNIEIAGTILVIMATFTIAKLRFIYASATALSIFIAFHILGIFLHGTSENVVSNQAAFLLGAILLGTIANYFLEVQWRTEFLINRELHFQKEEAENATKLKDNFLALVSHDLRAPLGSIIGMLSPFENKNIEFKKSEIDRARRARQIAIDLTETINRLLDISRLQTGNLKPKKSFFKGSMLTNSTIEHFKYSATEKNISITSTLPDDMKLFGDRVLIGEVVNNLLSNSIKFCGSGDVISIFQPEGRPTTIAIKDTGPGINSKLLDNLFRHDIKTSTAGTGGEKGTGLGLPYCRDIMNAHGGSLTVDSEEGNGSTFYTRLPKIESLIAIADNDEVQCDIIKEQLRAVTNAEIIEIRNGKNLFDILTETQLTLLIFDLSLPGADRFETIRKISNTFTIPLLVTSQLSTEGEPTYTADDLKNEIISLGASEFIEKPINPKQLLRTIEKYLS